MPSLLHVRIAVVVAALYTSFFLQACATTEVSQVVETETVEFVVTPTVEVSETSTTPPTVVAVSPSPISFPSPLPPETSKVEVVVAKNVYEVGEDILYTIINHSDKPIYYRYSGCDFPLIVQWVDDEEVILVTNVLDVEPYLQDIEPSESVTCGWDQTFYNGKGDPEVQNHRYQVRFLYAFTEEDVDVPGGQLMARSQVFAIE